MPHKYLFNAIVNLYYREQIKRRITPNIFQRAPYENFTCKTTQNKTSNNPKQLYVEPLGLEMIYSVFEQSHTVEIFDMMIEKFLQKKKIGDFEPDRVGITSLCIDVLKVIELSNKIKACNNNIKIFVGGTQALLSPESFFEPSIDYVFNYTTKDNLIKFLNNDKSIEGVYQKENSFKDSFPKGNNEYMLPNRASTLKYRAYYSYFGYRLQL